MNGLFNVWVFRSVLEIRHFACVLRRSWRGNSHNQIEISLAVVNILRMHWGISFSGGEYPSASDPHNTQFPLFPSFYRLHIFFSSLFQALLGVLVSEDPTTCSNSAIIQWKDSLSSSGIALWLFISPSCLCARFDLLLWKIWTYCSSVISFPAISS